jgi:hypothetical protein
MGVVVVGVEDGHISRLRNQVKLLTMLASQPASALAAHYFGKSEPETA